MLTFEQTLYHCKCTGIGIDTLIDVHLHGDMCVTAMGMHIRLFCFVSVRRNLLVLEVRRACARVMTPYEETISQTFAVRGRVRSISYGTCMLDILRCLTSHTHLPLPGRSAMCMYMQLCLCTSIPLAIACARVCDSGHACVWACLHANLHIHICLCFGLPLHLRLRLCLCLHDMMWRDVM